MTNAIIRNRHIVFISEGGSETSTTRAQLEKDTAELVHRIETKIKSESQLAIARETLALYGRALELAKANGL
ncbi:hypothetical protein [Limoniibacter endophyticus]|uniref:Uncharacterized protein n=1 Tax=Limoniibacter endophyticus TaxID=1565040 RepID=A0A8J3GJN1_9HYPH|nr:hypothetical protein [Limoniibacter endophyticus]GHC79246.1 hypothetical protein GCM10010136_31650 [Limoniibacter endophyticus]